MKKVGIRALFFVWGALHFSVPTLACTGLEELVARSSVFDAATHWPTDAPNPKFGMEATFATGSRDRFSAADLDRVHAAMKEWAEKDPSVKVSKQGDFSVLPHGDYISGHAFVVTLTLETGSSLSIVVKPDGYQVPVIEITNYKSEAPRFTEVAAQLPLLSKVWKKMEKLGYKPHPSEIGDGHFHMEKRSGFNNDALLLRNFLVDTLINHPQLHAPFLRTKRTKYQRFFDEAGPEYQDAFLKLIADFDRSFQTGQRMSYWELEMRMNQLMEKAMQEFPLGGKTFAIAFRRDTVEFRSVRPQSDPSELVLQYGLISGRLRYLKERNELIPISPPRFEVHSEEARTHMENYIREAGWNPVEYEPFFELGWGAKN